MTAPQDVLSFWVDEVGADGWYNSSDELDQKIRDQYGDLWQEASEGALGYWLTAPRGTLSYIILTDQFPRNMFRGHADAFAMDRSALAAAKMAVDRDWDLRIDGPVRQFFYLPMMHSENLCDQDRCIRLLASRMEGGKSNLLHAQVHREIIRMFGRFPYRNDALGRTTTAAEQDWMDAGGYRITLQQIQSETAETA
ncbi:MAG: DUF924 family protein [Pseudomonadota bacterium]